MRRRDFITTIAVGAAGWPLSVRADQLPQAPLIGVLFADRAEFIPQVVHVHVPQAHEGRARLGVRRQD